MAAYPCPGCLGSRYCWVCLGTGNADTARRLGVCSSCDGTAKCAYCDPDQPRRVVVLDDRVRRADVRRVMLETGTEEPPTGIDLTEAPAEQSPAEQS